MKLLFDQNISYRMVERLDRAFPDSNHVRLLGLDRASDEEIWNYARKHEFLIVTQDSDFYEMSLLYGFPPKIIWLRCGNTSTSSVQILLEKHTPAIQEFGDNQKACLEILDY